MPSDQTVVYVAFEYAENPDDPAQEAGMLNLLGAFSNLALAEEAIRGRRQPSIHKCSIDELSCRMLVVA